MLTFTLEQLELFECQRTIFKRSRCRTLGKPRGDRTDCAIRQRADRCSLRSRILMPMNLRNRPEGRRSPDQRLAINDDQTNESKTRQVEQANKQTNTVLLKYLQSQLYNAKIQLPCRNNKKLFWKFKIFAKNFLQEFSVSTFFNRLRCKKVDNTTKRTRNSTNNTTSGKVLHTLRTSRSTQSTRRLRHISNKIKPTIQVIDSILPRLLFENFNGSIRNLRIGTNQIHFRDLSSKRSNL